MKNRTKTKYQKVNNVKLIPHPLALPIYQHYLSLDFQAKNYSYIPTKALSYWLRNEHIDVLKKRGEYLFFSNFRAISLAIRHDHLSATFKIHSNPTKESIEKAVSNSYLDAVLNLLNIQTGPEIFQGVCRRKEIDTLLKELYGRNPFYRTNLSRIFGIKVDVLKNQKKRIRKQSEFRPYQQTELEI